MIDIILYRPEKPANVGNIMRTVMASKSRLFIIGPITFSLDDKSLKRAGMDYLEKLEMTYYENYEEFLKKYERTNIIYVTRYGKKPFTSYQKDFEDPSVPLSFMFGRESTGIPHEVLKEHTDKLLRIPMASDARSLNLSNSVAIVLYYALGCQNFPSLSTEEEIKGPDFLY